MSSQLTELQFDLHRGNVKCQLVKFVNSLTFLLVYILFYLLITYVFSILEGSSVMCNVLYIINISLYFII